MFSFMVTLQWFSGTRLLLCLMQEEASLLILSCMGGSAEESREWDLPKPGKYSLELFISTYNFD